MLRLRDAGPPRPPDSLYVHVPFCRDRCTYCAFPTVRDRPERHAALVSALRARAAASSFPAPLTTLYLGGGTPALLAPELLRQLLDGIREHVIFDPKIEITLEANPANITADALAAWAALGVTRVSVGVQTFADESLRRLARLHDADDARCALRLLATTWRSTWSADLLVGLAGQTSRDLLADVDELLGYSPPHVSVYGLTIEPRTPLAALAREGRAVTAPAHLAPDFDAAWSTRLCHAGLERYEVSNFARPGQRSRHNQAYWSNASYLGLGPGAASSIPPFRWVEREEPEAWMAAAHARRGVRRAVERLSPGQRLLESVWLGLRTCDGVDVVELDRRFGGGWRERVLPAARALLDADVLHLDRRLRLRPADLPRADAVGQQLAAACLAEDLPVADGAP